nr:hypothetical protein Iba_scaffold807287CG0010 [Ipomoea batatas]
MAGLHRNRESRRLCSIAGSPTPLMSSAVVTAITTSLKVGRPHAVTGAQTLTQSTRHRRETLGGKNAIAASLLLAMITHHRHHRYHRRCSVALETEEDDVHPCRRSP